MDSTALVQQNVLLNWIRHGKRKGHINERLWQMLHYILGNKMNHLAAVWKINNLHKTYLLFYTYSTCVFLSYLVMELLMARLYFA
jgi:hypothetical protein